MDSSIKEAASFAPGNVTYMPGNGLSGWLNRNFFAFGLTSMLGDVCHEIATAVLPQFMRTIGTGAASLGVLGVVNGVGDPVSNLVVGLLWMRLWRKMGFRLRGGSGPCGRLVDERRKRRKTIIGEQTKREVRNEKKEKLHSGAQGPGCKLGKS